MSTSSPPPACSPSEAQDELDSHIPPEALPPEDVFTRAFWELKPLADALPAEQVKIMNAHPELAYVNAKNGVAAFDPHLGAARELPGVDIQAILRVSMAALALLGASHRLNLLVAPEKELPNKLFEGRKMRKALLHVAHAAATLGLVPEELVARIVKGRGSLDTARDLIDLSLMMREYEPRMRDQLALHPKLLTQAADLGTWLRDALQPTNAPAKPKATPAEIKQGTDDRNRMWTLLADGYAELQRVAAFLRVDVPSLQSRRALKKKVKGEG